MKSVDINSGLPVVTEDSKKVGVNTSWWKSMFNPALAPWGQYDPRLI